MTLAWVSRFLLLVLMAALLLGAACSGEPSTKDQSAENLPQEQKPAIKVVLPGSDEPFIPTELSDASPPPDQPDRASGSFGFSHYVFEEVGGEVLTTLVEGPREGQVRSPISYLALKRLYDEGELLPNELQMSREELGGLLRQLDTVRDAAEKYHDIEEALAEGYVQLSDDVPNMGAHFTSPERVLDGVFDPSEPEILLYSREDGDSWRLTGTAFILLTQQVGQDHPDAFAGPLDNWHVHYSLCTGPLVSSSRSSTAEECEAEGGTWVPSFGWMIHAWVVVDNPLGVFSMWNPNVPPVAQASDVRQAVSTAISQEGTVNLTIENFGHLEARLEVGQIVVWTTVDGVPHTVTSDSRGVAEGSFDSGYIAPGQSFALRFDRPGEYPYVCTLHPFMTGTVIVGQ